MTFNYFPNVPNAPDDPADDQPEMQVNTLSTQNLIAIDHVTFNTTNGGYHKVIHFIRQNSDPALIGTIGQLYTKQITFNGIPDEALFFESGAGRVTQLTTVVTASLNTNGYAFLPGGVLMQWGQVATFPGGSVTFTPNFSGDPYSIQLTANASGSSGSSRIALTVVSGSVDATGFKYRNDTTSISVAKIYWVAIGPA